LHYAEYLDWAACRKGLHDGTLFQGVLRVNARRRKEGYGAVQGLPFDLFVEDTDQNRALPTDEVVLQVLPEKDWVDRYAEGATSWDPNVVDAGMDALMSSAPAAPTLADAMAGLNLEGGAVEEAKEAAATETAEAKGAAREEMVALWNPRFNFVAHRTRDVTDAAAAVAAAPADAATAAAPPTPPPMAVTDSIVSPARNVLSRASPAYKQALARLAQRADELKRRPRARVVFLTERRHPRRAVGVFQPPKGLREGMAVPPHLQFMLFMPSDKRLPLLKVLRRDCPEEVLANPFATKDTLYFADIGEWSVFSISPLAHITTSFGEAGTVEAESQALLEENGVNHGEFGPEVLACLEPFRKGLKGAAAAGEGAAEGAAACAGSCEEDEGDAADTAWEIPAEERASRRDFTGHRIFTIDPTTARDLDDALHVRDMGDGTVEMGVHIADVSYFVRPRTELDEEARLRATTVYLVQRAVPMLPRLLCENLCSLNPNVERLAFSVTWRMNRNGELVDKEPWFGRSIIRSCCKLDYATAQRVIDGKITPEDAEAGSIGAELWESARRPTGGHTELEVVRDIQLMHTIAAARRRRRFQSGALSINLPKLVYDIDPETGRPVGVRKYEGREANKLVEEYMLLANYLVAEYLVIAAGPRAFLRCHPPPQSKIVEIASRLQQLGLRVNVSTAADLHRSMLQVKRIADEAKLRLQSGQEPLVLEPPARKKPKLSRSQKADRVARGLPEVPPDYEEDEYDDRDEEGRPKAPKARIPPETMPYLHELVTSIISKPLCPAKYFTVADTVAVAWRHYALNIPYYTHFTSPIRRYADVMVHRLLDAILQARAAGSETLGSYHMEVEELADVADHCNDKKTSSKRAQERSDLVFLCLYLHDNPMVEPAVVVNLGGEKFAGVVIPRLGLDVPVYMDRSGFEGTWVEKEHVLYARRVSKPTVVSEEEEETSETAEASPAGVEGGMDDEDIDLSLHMEEDAGEAEDDGEGEEEEEEDAPEGESADEEEEGDAEERKQGEATGAATAATAATAPTGSVEHAGEIGEVIALHEFDLVQVEITATTTVPMQIVCRLQAKLSM